MAKDSSKKWLERIDTSWDITRDYRKDYRTFVNYYRGKQWSLEGANEGQVVTEALDSIVVNWTFNTIRTIVPTVFFKNPRIFPQATREEFIDRVPLIRNIANYDWRILNIKKEMKRTILRSLIGGLAWLETGYSFIEEEIENDTPDTSGLTPEEILAGQREGEPEQKFSELRIRKDSPYVLSRSLVEVAVDPFASELDELAWHAVREVKPLEFVKKDPRFKGTRKLKANMKMDDIQVNRFKKEMTKRTDGEFVELWHVTDRWRGKTFTVARGHVGMLREFDTPLGYDLVPMFFNEDPEATQHLSIVGIMKDQQDEINRLRSFMLEHVKRTLPRMAYNRDIMTDEEDINRLAESEQAELIGVPGDPNQAIKAINFPSLSPDLYAADNRMAQDMQISSGLSDFQRGQAAKVPSATEAQLIEQSSRLRVDEGLDIVSDVAEKVTKNIVQLRQQFTTGVKSVPIVGPDNVILWEQLTNYTRERIQGDYEYIVEYGSTQKRDDDFLRNQWLTLAPTLANLAQNPTPANLTIGRELGRAFKITQAVIDQIFPDPQQAQQGAPGIAPPVVNPQEIFNLLGGQ